MADAVRVCVFLYFFCNFCAALVTKEFFCQDPDTEQLHHVNTTWSSTTFCGNYTCKLQRRLNSDMDTEASNVNKVSSNPYDIYKGFYSKDNKKAELSITTKRELPEETTKNILQTDIVTNFLTPKRDSDKDRFLNDDEIKSISELLHTIKKSDIDAIVEVYNLAQDIYKEMETKTTKNEVTFNEVKFAERSMPAGTKTSYWYDPLYHTDYTFDRVKDITLKEQVDAVPTVVASNFYPIYSSPYTEKITIPYTVQRQPVPMSNLPYYPNMVVKNKVLPVKDVLRNHYTGYDQNQPCPWSNKVLKNQYTYYQYPKPNVEAVAKLLPLPFTYFNNYDHYFPKLYRQSWNRTRQNQQTPYTKMEVVQQKPAVREPNTLLAGLPDKTYSQSVTQSSHLDIMNEILENDISNQNIRATKDVKPIQDTLSKTLKEKQEKLAPWQTLPLSQKILDEVKANILESTDNFLKPFSLKKKLRLARVAKVLKLDDLERKRREIVEVTRGDVLEENDFEVYLEKITCEVGTDPGLFSLGDLSLPFPACCPQKLNRGYDKARTSQKPAESTTQDSLVTNTLETNSECTENGKVTVPLSALSPEVSKSYSLTTPLSPSPSTETLKLTTNTLGISTLSSTADVVASTLKTSSSTPQTTTSDYPPTNNSKTTPVDLLISELSVLSSKSSKLPELLILPTKSSEVSELSILPSKSSNLKPDLPVIPTKLSEVSELSILQSKSSKEPKLSTLTSSEIPELSKSSQIPEISTKSSEVSDLSIFPSKSSNLTPDLSIISSNSSKEPKLSTVPSTSSKVPVKSSSRSSTAIASALGLVRKLSTLPISNPSTIKSDVTVTTTESSSSTEKSFKSFKYSHLKF